MLALVCGYYRASAKRISNSSKRINGSILCFQDAEKLTDRTRDALEWARVQYGIAELDYDRGQYSDAERLLGEVLKERERILGPEHADTLCTRTNLEVALFYQGKYSEAEEQIRILLALKEKALGPEHPGTLNTRNNLGGLLRNIFQRMGRSAFSKMMSQKRRLHSKASLALLVRAIRFARS